MDIDWPALKKELDRRDFVVANAPHCPRCREQVQIQVLAYAEAPAKWKCRTCKHRFEHEPAATG